MLIKDPPVEIARNLWMLGTTAYPFYLYRGADGGTLFEGGIGPSGPVLREQLAQLGLAGAYLKQLVVTHAHPDHVMAIPLVRELSPGIKVWASEIAAQTLANEKAVGFFCKLDDALAGALTQAGLVAAEQRRSPLAENRIAVDQVLKEGDLLTVDQDVQFQVLATPGHSDCLLSFYQPQARLLIISDTTGYYLPQFQYWWPNYFTDYGAYVRSIERLAELDAEVLGLSHNGVIQGAADVAAYFRDVLAATRAYHDRIVADATSGKSVRDIAAVLGAEVHAKAPVMPLDFFQKNCGLLVKNSLKHAGIALDQ